MKEKLLKFIDWILNREVKVNEQNDYSVTIVNGDVTIINVKIDDNDEE